MTTSSAPSMAGPVPQLSPFGQQPSRWERKRSRAVRGGHVSCGFGCADGCEPVLVRERTAWGWLEWTVPADGSMPETPYRMGILTPTATRVQRLGLRWLTRRPARHLALDRVTGSLRFSAAVVALVTLLTALFAAGHGLALGIVLPAMFLALLLAEHLPGQLDARALEHVRTVEGDGSCRYLQRLAALHTSLVAAAAGHDRHEVRRAVQIGHQQLFDAADLLQNRDTRSVSGELIARERLMLQLTHQVRQIITPTQAGPPPPHDDRLAGQPPPAPGPARPRPAASHTAPAQPQKEKEETLMPQDGPEQPTSEVYLLFAHEPYYPAVGQEINTSLVAAATLLHPHIRQPDGTRIHDRLVHGRSPGEIVPLATLTHELDGGARWPQIGDWETVTADLLRLIQGRGCDALSLGLPDIARALVCCGPHSEVRVHDPATGRQQVYGPADRSEVLAEIGQHLLWAQAGAFLWPGDGLLPPLNSADGT